MKTSAEKSSTTTSATATHAASQPFFAKAGGGNFFSAFVQAKLTVGKPGDAFEKEADAVADQVVKRTEAVPVMQNKSTDGEEKDQLRRQSLAETITPFVQRQEEESTEEAEDKEEVQTKPLQHQAENQGPEQAKFIQKMEEEGTPVQTKTAEQALPTLNPAIKNRLSETKGQGSPLSDSSRKFMEAGFGIDFGHVRIHTDSSAVELSKNLRSQAFTHGSDIYFNEGKYNPAATDDQKLLAHELTHVVQQNKSRGVPIKPAGRKINEKNALEPAKFGSASGLPPSKSAVSTVVLSASTNASAAPQGVSSAKIPAVLPGQKEIVKGSPSEKEEALVVELSALGFAKAPAKPEEDPAFQKAKLQVRAEAKKQKKGHATANKKREEAEKASALSSKEQEDQSAKEKNTEEMERKGTEQRKAGESFSAETFKDDLLSRIKGKGPKTESQAKEFAKKPPIEHFEEDFSKNVAAEQGKVIGPLKEKADPNPKGGVAEKIPVAIPNPIYQSAPKLVDPKLATPKPKTDQEISLQHESESLDVAMQKNRLSDEQLAESREPSFVETLKVKQETQQKLAEAPGVYRQREESAILKKAETQTNESLSTELGGMGTIHHKIGSHIHGRQQNTETETEKRQREIKENIDGIYQGTVVTVKGILESMANKVKEDFTNSLKLQTNIFNENVRSGISNYYGDWRIDDKLFGPDDVVVLADGTFRSMTVEERFGVVKTDRINPDVYKIFVKEKNNFITAMDVELDKIANDVQTGLNAAQFAIQFGKTAIAIYKTTLKGEELEFAKGLELEVQMKFENLESSIDDAREDLLQTLADQYSDNVNQLEKSFNEINDELKKSWLDRAVEFIETVAKTIFELADLLLSILTRIAGLVWDIVKHPIRFFETLVKGLLKGVATFIGDIGTYLEEAFWSWITGASAAKGIQLGAGSGVEKLFGLVVQVLNISKQDLKKLAEKIFEKEIVELVEKGLAIGERVTAEAQKLLEPAMILMRDGVSAFWSYLKDTVGSMVQGIFDKIKETVFFEFVKKGLLWIAGFFVPGGGFVKVVKALFAAVSFLVDNIDNIKAIFNAVLDSFEKAILGDESGVAAKVVTGLKTGVVLALDFLARQLGLGKILDKVHHFLQSLRKPILQAIEWVMRKVKTGLEKIGFFKLMKKVGDVVKKGKDAVVKKLKKVKQRILKWWKSKIEFSLPNGASHKIFLRGDEHKQTLAIRSEEMTYVKFLETQKENADDSKKAAIDRALPIAEKIDQIKDEPVKDEDPEEEKRKKQEKGGKIQAELVKLRKETIDIFGSDIPDSTQPQTVETYLEMGKKMEVEPLTHKIKIAGTPPTSSGHPVYDNINLRKNSAGSDTSFYIRGHLLNQKLGGQGKWDNMTPLSRSGNAQHESKVESVVKTSVDSGAIVKYTVIANYAPRSDKDTLKNDIEAHETNVANIPVKHSIVDAEDSVPESLTCEASIRKKGDSNKYDFERSLVSATVQNNINRSHTEYHLSGSPAPPRVNLNARHFQEYLPLKKYGLTSVMGMVIVSKLQERGQAYGRYTIFKNDNKQIPEGVHDKLENAPTSEVFLGKLGDRANKYPST